jgi:hypothetical protein
MPAPLLEARNLRKTFSTPASALAMPRSNGGARSGVRAVDDVNL